MGHIVEIQDYWDKRARGFSLAVEEELNTDSSREWEAFFCRQLPGEGLDILDDGTGAGFFPVILTRLGHRITAIDYSHRMVEAARERFRAQGVEVSVFQMDAQALQFDDASFDAVVSRNVLWNLDDPDRAYGEMYRVLRPGGLLIVEDGNMYLHLHDGEYAAARERAMAEAARQESGSLHSRHNVDNVDFSIIERIAGDLPMSAVRRPQWDFDLLLRLGFSEINVEIRGEPLPMGFRITARKRGDGPWQK